MGKVKNPPIEEKVLVNRELKTVKVKLWAFANLSHAEADPRSNLGHKDAASAYFLSTIR